MKKWTYAGFAFDLAGATYSGIVAGGMNAGVHLMPVPIGPRICSYLFFHKKLKEGTADSGVKELSFLNPTAALRRIRP